MKLLIVSLITLHHMTAALAGRIPSRLQIQHPLLATQTQVPAPHTDAARRLPGHSPFSVCAGHDSTLDLFTIASLDFDFRALSLDDDEAQTPGLKHGYATALRINGTLSPHADILHAGMRTTAQIQIRRDDATAQLLAYDDVALIAMQGDDGADPPVEGGVVFERQDWWDAKLVRSGRYHARIVSTTRHGQTLFCVEADIGLRVGACLEERGVPSCEQR